MLESFGPERTVEDVLAGRLRVTLGGETYVLPVRSIASNRRWVESLDAEMIGLLVAVSEAGDDITSIMSGFMQIGAEQLLNLVIAYDETGVLPPREQLEEVVRPHETLMAVMGIRRVQNPLADAGLAAMLNTELIAGMQLPAPTNSPPTNGTSRRRKRSTKA